MKKYVISEVDNRTYGFLFEEDKPVLINVYGRNEDVLLGDVYVGRVQNIVKNINSAFVEVKKDMPCYYSLSDNTKHIFLNRKNTDKVCQGDLLLVQVSREAIKSKVPALSSDISFTGNCVAMALDSKKEIQISNKITDNEYKKTLRSKIKDIYKDYDIDCSLVVRTHAYECSQDEVLTEARKWCELAAKIKRESICRPAFTCLYKKEEMYISDIREEKFTALDEVITDIAHIHENILESNVMGDAKLTLYYDKLLPLYKLYSLEKHLQDALSKKVWLKSGAYLIIEPTEALTVIDVNTGKFDGNKKDREETFLKINLEAAKEISRQLRLRNISGIIIIDFINLEKNENNRLLISKMEKELSNDKVMTRFVEMTQLGLMEITRKKIKKPLLEYFLQKI